MRVDGSRHLDFERRKRGCAFGRLSLCRYGTEKQDEDSSLRGQVSKPHGSAGIVSHNADFSILRFAGGLQSGVNGQADLVDSSGITVLYLRSQLDSLGGNGKFGGRKFRAVPTIFDGFNANFTWLFGRLHDDLRETIEERTLGFLVGLLAVGIAVAHADKFALA
jgi:hypothetical protein